MGLPPSGGGKGHARKLNRKILLHVGRPDMCGPERIGSHAGVVSALAENWNTLFQFDEIGRLLTPMQSAPLSPHLYNVASVLLLFYSSVAATSLFGMTAALAEGAEKIGNPGNAEGQ